MLKKLLWRHRSVRYGAALVGASALAIGFASPALAAQSVNNGNADNANAQNYLVVQGGSNTTYLMMQALANIFNQAPGCDLTSGGSNQEQELDYGCPGLDGNPGVNQSTPTIVPQAGSTLVSSKNVTVASTTGFLKGMAVSDTGGAVPAGDTVKSVTSSTVFKLKTAATATDASDTINVTTVPAAGENGFTTFGNENPFNDVLVEEPSLGSSNGVQELEGTGSASVVGHSNNTFDPLSPAVGPVPVSPIDVARSSRAPNLSGAKQDHLGLNFVAYAEDAVDYIYWSEVNGSSFANTAATAATDPAGCIANSTTNPNGANNEDHAVTLKDIWNATYTNWGQVCSNATGGVLTALDAQPIDVYWAQNGSGTESTWATLLGLGFNASNSNSAHVIFENETSSILRNGDEANAMFFFSYGKFKTLCTPTATATTIISSNILCTGSTTSKVEMGQIDGVLPSTATINDQLPGFTGEFPGDRLLYNVYSDGADPSEPASAPAALNIVSEDGFLCKPSTSADIDPNTGSTYLSEIDSTIKAQGFLALPLEVEDGQGVTANANYNTTHAGIPNPAWTTGGLSASKYAAANETGAPWNFPAANTDTDNSAISGSYSNVLDDGVTGTATATTSAPVGYCLTLTTDGETGGTN